jgi:signal transduction histidine kinase
MKAHRSADLQGDLERADRVIRLQKIILSAVDKVSSFRELTQVFLDEICAFTRWPLGHAYFLAEASDDLLLPSNLWHADGGDEFEPFRHATSLTPLLRGKGLPGMVLESGKPRWVADVSLESGFPRNRLAVDLGIKAGFAFPIKVKRQVIGVMEFYSKEALSPDPDFMTLIEGFGSQLESLFQRQKAEEDLRCTRDQLAELVRVRTAHLAEINDSLQLEMLERRRAEAELRSQNRVLELIARGTPRQDLFSALLRSIEELEPGTLGSILLLDASTQTLCHAMAPRLPEDYIRAIDGARIGPQAGSCGTAAYLGQRIVVENIETDPLWKDYSAIALRYGLRACWSQPFFSRDGAVLGTFAMYYHSPKRPSGVVLRVLETAAKLAEVAVECEQLARSLKSSLSNLKRTNLELEQFVLVASHDLQEPLRMVTTYLQYLEALTGKLGPEEKQAIGFASTSAIRMREMIQSLLSYARAWREPLTVEPAPLNPLVEQALLHLKVAIESTGARINVGALPTLPVNSHRVVQLFQNLIGNSLKYRSEATPEIHIEAERKDGEWLFSVRDNGIGIDPQYSQQVFGIFQRLNPDREKFPGTGIGLAICQKIVERHGGRIWVRSARGKGATFFFTLSERQADAGSC